MRKKQELSEPEKVEVKVEQFAPKIGRPAKRVVEKRPDFVLYLAFNKNRTRQRVNPETGRSETVDVDPKEKKVFPVTVTFDALGGGTPEGIMRWVQQYNERIVRVRRGEANLVTPVRLTVKGEESEDALDESSLLDKIERNDEV